MGNLQGIGAVGNANAMLGSRICGELFFQFSYFGAKNVLAMAMNASAVILFTFSNHVNWSVALVLSIGGIGGGFAGNWLVHRMPEKIMRGFVVLVGVTMTVWLFLR